MAQGDRNFDKLASRLKKNIYSSDKGTVRLAVLKHDMLRSISEITEPGVLKILDAGGGMGQIARWLAEFGHKVTLCDLSAEMLAFADEENKKSHLEGNITLIHAALQELPTLLSGQTFDLILLHGVIEWMEFPCNAIETLSPMLNKNGAISLLFFNRDKLILKWGINGQTEKAMSGIPTNSRLLTPQAPLTVNDLSPSISGNNLEIFSKAGIRIFYGFFAKMIHTRASDEASIDLEKHYSRIEPFASLGEHTHLVLRQMNHSGLNYQ